MKHIFISVAALALCAGCASTPDQTKIVQLQVQNNAVQMQILQTLLDIKARQGQAGHSQDDSDNVISDAAREQIKALHKATGGFNCPGFVC